MSRALCLILLSSCGPGDPLSIEPAVIATSTQELALGTYSRHVTVRWVPPTERVVPIEDRGKSRSPYLYVRVAAPNTVDASVDGAPSSSAGYTLTHDQCPVDEGCTFDLDLTLTISSRDPAPPATVVIAESVSAFGGHMNLDLSFSEWR